MDPAEQLRWLRILVEASAQEGCLVAPVGSVYLLLQDRARLNTKDVDGVIHMGDGTIASLEVVKRVARRIGTPEVAVDKAVVSVALPSGDKIELIRGRSGARGGFFPRELLRAAAAASEQKDGVLIYPTEHMVVLKADAACDRRERAKRDAVRAAVHIRRAEAFEADVFAEVQRANTGDGLDVARIRSAIGHLKRPRRAAVAAMLRAAGVELDGNLK